MKIPLLPIHILTTGKLARVEKEAREVLNHMIYNLLVENEKFGRILSKVPKKYRRKIG